MCVCVGIVLSFGLDFIAGFGFWFRFVFSFSLGLGIVLYLIEGIGFWLF